MVAIAGVSEESEHAGSVAGSTLIEAHRDTRWAL
jgi:hypothetical protein